MTSGEKHPMHVEPNDFVDEGPDIRSQGPYRAIVSYQHIIVSAGVKSPCRVDGAVVTEVSGHDPEPDLWFLIKCKNFYRAEFYLVTDGDKWTHYDAKRKHLTNGKKPAKSIDLNKLNQIDREIIQLAIANYILDGGIDANPNACANPGQTAPNQARRVVRI